MGSAIPGNVRADGRAGPILLLSLVHPDFLAPVYSLSQVLCESGFRPTILSFSSLASGRYHPGAGITMVDCGPHAGSAGERRRARRTFREMAERTFSELAPAAVIATCCSRPPAPRSTSAA
jgi:hypothetical protein